MINGVSFGNDINALIAAQPSNATAPQESIGAYSMNDEGDKVEISTGHPVLKTVGTLAVIAAALGLARGKMSAIKEIDLGKSLKETEGFMGKVKWLVAKGGEAVIDGVKHTKALFSKTAKLEIKDAKMAKLDKDIEKVNAEILKATDDIAAAADDPAKATAKTAAEAAKKAANEKLTKLNETKTALQKEIDDLKPKTEPEAPKTEPEPKAE